MKPPEIKYLVGNALEVLMTLPDGMVQTVATSPPYWSLRDYESPVTIWGEKERCNHKWGRRLKMHQGGKNGSSAVMEGRDQSARNAVRDRKAGQFCKSCGAWRGALGLEPTPELYVQHLVEIFREIKRVLRKDGTVWLNLGDCYAGSGGMGSFISRKQKKGLSVMENYHRAKAIDGIKPKDLVGIPWRVAFALQADGWHLRKDIIWNKSNVMPESVTDRPTSAHEYIFLFAQEQDYFYDYIAIQEPCVTPMDDKSAHTLGAIGGKMAQLDISRLKGKEWSPSPFKNKRDVWTVTTKPYSAAHFATFPPDLIEPCILAGTSERGMCPTCGAPWQRVIEKQYLKPAKRVQDIQGDWLGTSKSRKPGNMNSGTYPTGLVPKTIGWYPTCECYGVPELPQYPRPPKRDASVLERHKYQETYDKIKGERALLVCNCAEMESIPCWVLDPFAGSGTTNMVSRDNGRSSVGIDISEKYRKLAATRAEVDTPPLDNFGGDEDEQIHDKGSEEGTENGN